MTRTCVHAVTAGLIGTVVSLTLVTLLLHYVHWRLMGPGG
jgi:hypothetical protein